MSSKSTGTSPYSVRREATERVFRGAVLFAVAAVPCAVLPFSPDVYVAPKLALAALASLVAVAALAVSGSFRRAASRVDGPLCAFGAAVLVASAASMDPWLSWFGTEQRYIYGVTGWAAMASGFYLGCSLRRSACEDETLVRDICRALCAGSLVVSSRALWVWIHHSYWEGGKAVMDISTIGFPFSTALYLSMLLPAAWSLCRGAGPERILGAASFFLGACALGTTGSRSGILALAGGAAAYAWMLRGRTEEERARPEGERPRMDWLFLAGALSGALLLGGTLLIRSAAFAANFGGYRLDVWRIAVRIFADQPWLGSGPGTFSLGYLLRRTEELAYLNFDVAHNDWLDVLATMGAAGAGTYAWLHLAALGGLGTLRKGKGGAAFAPVVAAVGAFFVCTKINPPNIGVAWVAAVMAGAALGTGADEAPPSPGEEKDRPSRAVPPWAQRFRPGPALLACGALWIAFFSLRALEADYHYMRAYAARSDGRALEADAHFRKAVSWRPEAVVCRIEYVNTLWFESEHAERPEDRRWFLLRATELALDGLKRRPLDSTLNFLLGRAELRRWKAGEKGRLDFARAAQENALRLNPFYEDALKDRAEIAGLQGDALTRRRLEALVRRIDPRKALAL